MKTTIVLSLLSLFALSCYAQEKQISLYGGYPIAFGNNFIHKTRIHSPSGTSVGYRGLFNSGVDAAFFHKTGVMLGASLQRSRLNYRDSVALNMWRPKVLVGYRITTQHFNIIPQIGLGYTHFHFRYKYCLSEQCQTSYVRYAVSLHAGSRFSMRTKGPLAPFLQVDCEFNKIAYSKKYWFHDVPFNRNTFFFYPQIGLSWTHKRKKTLPKV